MAVVRLADLHAAERTVAALLDPHASSRMSSRCRDLSQSGGGEAAAAYVRDYAYLRKTLHAQPASGDQPGA